MYIYIHKIIFNDWFLQLIYKKNIIIKQIQIIINKFIACKYFFKYGSCSE